jgi:hypothetical protein
MSPTLRRYFRMMLRLILLCFTVAGRIWKMSVANERADEKV